MHVKAIECVIKLSFSQEFFSSCLVHFCLFVYLFRLLTCLLLLLVLPSTWKKTAACSSSSCYYCYNNVCKVSTVQSCWIVKRPDALSRFFNSHPFPWPLHAKTPLSLLGHPLPPLFFWQWKGGGGLFSSHFFFFFFFLLQKENKDETEKRNEDGMGN